MVAVRREVKPQPILATDDRGWQIHSSQPEKKQDSQFIKQKDDSKSNVQSAEKCLITKLHELNKYSFGQKTVAKKTVTCYCYMLQKKNKKKHLNK